MQQIGSDLAQAYTSTVKPILVHRHKGEGFRGHDCDFLQSTHSYLGNGLCLNFIACQIPDIKVSSYDICSCLLVICIVILLLRFLGQCRLCLTTFAQKP